MLLGSFTNSFFILFQEMLEVFVENRKLYQKNQRLQRKLAFYESSINSSNKVAAGYIVQVSDFFKEIIKNNHKFQNQTKFTQIDKIWVSSRAKKMINQNLQYFNSNRKRKQNDLGF
jgi:hypothetical protein